MELKTARLTVLIDPAKKKAFETLCARQDVTPSQIVRRLIRDYLIAHEMTFIPSGSVNASASTELPPKAVDNIGITRKFSANAGDAEGA